MIKEMIIAIMELQYYFPTLSVILLRALNVSICVLPSSLSSELLVSIKFKLLA